MDDTLDIPEESMRHIEALLARHRPDMIQRMFQQAMESRRSSVASSQTVSSISSNATGSSYRSSAAPSFRTSTTTSYHSRMSMQSNHSTSTISSTLSSVAPSIASSTSSVSSRNRATPRRTEPRSYPALLDPTRPSLDPTRSAPAALTPTSEMDSPIDTKLESFTPTDEDMSIASFPTDRGASQSGDSFMFCTYCAEAKTLKTFKAKSDWKKHEMRMHETGEDWPCLVNGCHRIFDRQKDFVKHHQRYHSGRPLPSLTDIGIQLLPRRVFGCGFDKCKEVSIGWDERCDHVAKHMKNGASFDQWKYSNVIRNLIRQEALHDTWKEIIACLNERLRESRSQISWCPDNTRVLRQKLQCCDLRPSREEVLITALSLRSDISLDPSQQQAPPGFLVPSRDSVPNVDKLSREQRMHILIGNPNASNFRSRLTAVNSALLRASHASPNESNFDCGASPFNDGPELEADARRISYMDIDTSDNYMDIPQPTIPDMHMPNPSTQPQSQPQVQPPMMETQQPQGQPFVDPAKSSNPLGLFYPSYFDATPQIEESPYYERPTLGQMISKPLQRIGSRLSRHGTPGSRPGSQPDHHHHPPPPDMTTEYQIQSPVHHMGRLFQQQQPQPPSMSAQQQQHQQQQQQHQQQQQYRPADVQQQQQQHHQQHHDQQLLFTSPI